MTSSALLFALLFPVRGAVAQVPLTGGFGVAPVPVRERLGGSFGLGAGLGAPTGISGKLWLGSNNALQFSAGGRWGAFKDLSASVDFIVHFRPINVEGDEFSLPLYAGAGVQTDVDFSLPGSQLLLGPRAVLGGTVLVPTLPVDVYLEVAPTLYLTQVVGWAMDGQIGARYYF